MMRKTIVLGIILFVLSGCFNQRLYYSERGHSMLVEELSTRNPIYLLLPAKSNGEKYELCIDWATFLDSYMIEGNYYDVDTSKKETTRGNYTKGFKAANKIVEDIYSKKLKYVEIDNIETSRYKNSIVNQEFYDKNFKHRNLKEVLIQYTKHNIPTGVKHPIEIDYINNYVLDSRYEELSLIKFLILNEFLPDIGGFSGRFTAFDYSEKRDKIPWEDIKGSWK